MPFELTSLPAFAAALALGYGLGSIPFGLILTRAAGLGDVRNIGSGNIGATNVLRTGNKALAAATLIGDALKGTIAVGLAWWAGSLLWGATPAGDGTLTIDLETPGRLMTIAAFAGFGAFLGHCFPVWLGFQGGKGVATYIGVLLGLDWVIALIFCAIWLIVALTTRYSSLSALIAAAFVPAIWLVNAHSALVIVLAMSTLLIVRHHANINRLMRGEETKIGAKSG
ncbi:MAG: glycerol-3-phosphate 1-O-acyltransferase PlsY [Pseudomonadota bacterium]